MMLASQATGQRPIATNKGINIRLDNETLLYRRPHGFEPTGQYVISGTHFSVVPSTLGLSYFPYALQIRWIASVTPTSLVSNSYRPTPTVRVAALSAHQVNLRRLGCFFLGT